MSRPAWPNAGPAQRPDPRAAYRPVNGGQPWTAQPYPPQNAAGHSAYAPYTAPAGRRPRPGQTYAAPSATKGRKARGKAARAARGGKKRNLRWVLLMLDIAIVAIVGVALYFLIKPMWDERQAVALSDKILAGLQKGQAQEVKIDKDFGKVNGERFEELPEGVQFVDNGADNSNQQEVALNYSGILVIPRIGQSIPLSDAVGSGESLRFGVAIHESFAGLLDPGLTSIFGHRFLTRGRDFNRLGEMEVGDQFYIDYLKDHQRHHYEVFKIDIIKEAEIYNRVYEEVSEKTVMLVTCHPITFGESSERLLIYAHPIEDKTEPIPAAASGK